MIPELRIPASLTLSTEDEQSRTYQLSENSIQGYVTDAEALRQAIYKILNTEKYEYPIYSFNYGIELNSLIGKDRTYVKIELMRRIKECLLEDERIIGVNNFNFTETGDELYCTFNVTSIFGEMLITREVNY
ncbi:DUF2634 domain-containing protein [Anaerocolumna sp. MB42-C2]|uniref:DUF2634 domain-containing protein n=1 Tax=Anaerocolumna sp. MB42-C2 TaxID=3070997 RepID=UPI0027E000F9|nr:DUF2634 domain-containing protein [Anaerocolumna sp. MB42-C2]WMJ90623.1 DUF2634 domain-containing protein [Anaerocolumna sp. MB42-C2]